MELRGNIKDNNLIIEITGRLSGDYAIRAEQLLRELRVDGDYEWTVFDRSRFFLRSRSKSIRTGQPW